MKLKDFQLYYEDLPKAKKHSPAINVFNTYKLPTIKTIFKALKVSK